MTSDATPLPESDREQQGALCLDCEHRAIWHHDDRGCQYHGNGASRCPCRHDSDQVVAALIAHNLRAVTSPGSETPAGGHAQPTVTPCAVGQAGREVAAAPPAGHDCAEARAWQDNYHGMAARWAECDTERLALKERLADAEMRLRLLANPPGASSDGGA